MRQYFFANLNVNMFRFTFFASTMWSLLTGTERLIEVSQSDKAFSSLTERHPRITARSTIHETAVLPPSSSLYRALINRYLLEIGEWDKLDDISLNCVLVFR